MQLTLNFEDSINDPHGETTCSASQFKTQKNTSTANNGRETISII